MTDIMKPESAERGLTVIAASVHGLLRPTCDNKLLAAGSAEIKVKPSAVFGNFWNFRSSVTLTLDGVKVILACTIPV